MRIHIELVSVTNQMKFGVISIKMLIKNVDNFTFTSSEIENPFTNLYSIYDGYFDIVTVTYLSDTGTLSK